MREVIDYLLANATDSQIVFGPIVWQPKPEGEGRRWYFMIATCGPDGFRCDSISADDSVQLVEDMRFSLMLAMVAPGRVLHDTDDELYAARLCETLWPGERITALRKTIERERAS